MVGQDLDQVGQISENKEKHHEQANEGPNEAVKKSVKNSNGVTCEVYPDFDVSNWHDDNFEKHENQNKEEVFKPKHEIRKCFTNVLHSSPAN